MALNTSIGLKQKIPKEPQLRNFCILYQNGTKPVSKWGKCKWPPENLVLKPWYQDVGTRAEVPEPIPWNRCDRVFSTETGNELKNQNRTNTIEHRGVLSTPDPETYLGSMIGIWTSEGLDFAFFSWLIFAIL